MCYQDSSEKDSILLAALSTCYVCSWEKIISLLERMDRKSMLRNILSIFRPNGLIFEQFRPASGKEEKWRLINYTNDIHIVCYGENGVITEE